MALSRDEEIDGKLVEAAATIHRYAKKGAILRDSMIHAGFTREQALHPKYQMRVRRRFDQYKKRAKKSKDLRPPPLTTIITNQQGPKSESSRISEAKQKEERQHQSVYNRAYKEATVALHDNQQRRKNGERDTKGAPAICAEINALRGTNLKPRTIQEAVKNGNIGVSPTRRGPKGYTPESHFNTLA